jgi:hypothetical protein
MKNSYTFTEALVSNLQLIADDAKDLAKIFEHDAEKNALYSKIAITGIILLYGVHAGDFCGSEKELFHTTLPLCQRICSEWHKYSFLL